MSFRLLPSSALFSNLSDQDAYPSSPIRNIFHMILGITLLVLGYIQISLGFDEYYSYRGRETPLAVKVVFYVVIGLEGLAYLIGLVWLVEKRRKVEGMGWGMAVAGLGRSGRGVGTGGVGYGEDARVGGGQREKGSVEF